VERLHQLLTDNRYPGRGVLWARTLDGAMCGGYFLTGRSDASKARALRLAERQLTVGPTTYRSDGQTVVTGDPFTEATTEAASKDDLLKEVWESLDPQYRVAAATFTGDGLADAVLCS